MPDINNLLFNQVLTNVSLDWSSPDLIAEQAVPFWDVSIRDPQVPIWDQDTQFELIDDLGSPYAEPGETATKISLLAKQVKDYVVKTAVAPAEQRQATAQSLDDLMDKATEDATRKLMMKYEYRIATLLSTAGNYATSKQLTVATDKWSDHTASNPIGDIVTALQAMWSRNSVTMVIGEVYYDHLRQNKGILDAVKSTPGGVLRGGAATREELLNFFEIKEILVGRGKYRAAGATQRFWGNMCALIVNAPNPGPRVMTFAASITETRRKVDTYFLQDVGTEGVTKIRVYANYIESVFQNQLGYLIYE